MNRSLCFALLLPLAALVGAVGPSDDVESHRARGKAHYERAEYALAVPELLEVLALRGGQARDHVNAGMALLRNAEYDRALAAFTTAKQMDPGLAAADFGLGVLYAHEARYPEAQAAFQRVAAADPGDPCAWFQVGATAAAQRRWPEAEQAFARVLVMGAAVAQNFYVSALYRQATVMQRQGRTPEAQKLFAEFQSRRDTMANVSLTAQALENGRHGRIETPAPAAEAPPAPKAAAAFVALADWRLDAAACAGVPRQGSPSPALGDFDADGLVDLFVANPCGPDRLLRNLGAGRFADATSRAGLGGSARSLGALFVDYENAGRPSLLVLRADGNRLYANRDGRFSDATEKSGLGQSAATPAAAALAFDADNDGQIDLFLTGLRPQDGGSARLFRNNGDGRFSDLTVAAGVAGRNAPAAAVADFDGDGFADLLLAGPATGAVLLRNLGGVRFQAVPVPLGSGTRIGAGARLEAGDFDHDGSFDAVLSSDAGWAVLRNAGPGKLEPVEGLPPLALRGAVLALEVGDGTGGFLARDAAGAAHLVSWRGARRFEDLPVKLPPAAASLAAWADLDGKGNTDLLAFGPEGDLRLLRRRAAGAGHWLGLRLSGEKSNRLGVGAVVELKAGRFYRKELARGAPLLVYTGERARLDVVRITWTNGVIQNELAVAADRRLDLRETDRQASSCPFLYVWDGRRFRFLTDLVGRAPLGERSPDGREERPNPDDYVRIPPGLLQARDGRYELRVTEELHEVAYLDAVELLAVDHPGRVSVYTDEGTTVPPETPLRLYAMAEERAPVTAVDERGRDLRPLLRRADGRCVGGFGRRRIPGVAEDHALVLDPGELPPGGALRLFLTGWVYWVNSSGRLALSQNRELALRGPALQVKDGDGRWVTAIDDIGLPAGLNRTIVVDLTGKLPAADPSVRIVTNLSIYWDRAFFATDAERIAPLVQRLPRIEADLHYRGFSYPVRAGWGPEPDLFDYERLLAEPPWNAPAGHYTRFGDVGTLLGARDDKLVAMAPGDELTLAFEAGGPPPLREGWRRDFVLHVTGWAKDNEPNTARHETVEPLPFLAMAGYPYAPGLAPAQDDFLEYLDLYQTRSAPALVPPLAPLASASP